MKSNIFKKAHELTKNIIKKDDSYKATFKLCLSFVYSQVKKGVEKMVELKGTEKQVKWAEDIRKICLDCLNKSLVFWQEESNRLEVKKGKPSKRTVRIVENIESFIEVIENEENSTWFINHFKYATRVDRGIVSDNLFDIAIGRKELEMY